MRHDGRTTNFERPFTPRTSLRSPRNFGNARFRRFANFDFLTPKTFFGKNSGQKNCQNQKAEPRLLGAKIADRPLRRKKKPGQARLAERTAATANFERRFTPRTWLRSPRNFGNARFRRFATFDFSTPKKIVFLQNFRIEKSVFHHFRQIFEELGFF